jgi:exo-beta-1,3-glucanase (GH17 family)
VLKIGRFFLIPILALGTYSGNAFAQRSDEFSQKILSLKWIAYSPTNCDPTNNNFPSEDTIRQDLELLYSAGFNGIVTYSSYSTFAEIPRIAQKIGFGGVIMGIWDIESSEEMENAYLASQYVDGYCAGNEGLNCRYGMETLINAIETLKNSTNKPVTTTEQIFDYYNDEVLAIGDWIFPNIHPFLCDVKDPEKAAKWIQKHYEILKRHAGTKLIIFKEVGYPTAGAREATPANQEEFFRVFETKGVPFIYFEGFDQYWKTDLPVEPHWGLFDSRRKPKKYIKPFIRNNLEGEQ